MRLLQQQKQQQKQKLRRRIPSSSSSSSLFLMKRVVGWSFSMRLWSVIVVIVVVLVVPHQGDGPTILIWQSDDDGRQHNNNGMMMAVHAFTAVTTTPKPTKPSRPTTMGQQTHPLTRRMMVHPLYANRRIDGDGDDNDENVVEGLGDSATTKMDRTMKSTTTTTNNVDGGTFRQNTNRTETISSSSSSPSSSSSLLLSPHHLMYPEAFGGLSAVPLDGAVPLLDALNLMKDSLASLLALQIDDVDMLSTRLGWDDKRDGQRNVGVLRIEQRISHDVDPLCWLQAQMDHNPFPPQPTTQASTVHGQYHPTFYFATAEGTLETAVYGSSRTHHGPLHDDVAWERMVRHLPHRARVYGGQRFDTGSAPSEEWSAFGRGLWILPAVEMRKDRHPSHWNARTRPSKRKDETLTLAIHVVAESSHVARRRPGDAIQRGNNDNKFSSSARHVLSVLDTLTDSSTAAIPPTTLPPVLSRNSNYKPRPSAAATTTTATKMTTTNSTRGPSASTSTQGSSVSRGAQGQSSPSLDGQELYERGVTAALKAFSATWPEIDSHKTMEPASLNSTTTKTTSTGSQKLEKVVLARRLDLQFAEAAQGNVRALDILRKWKFSNSQPGGHLFYLSPHGGCGTYEFFGCTPERLFKVQTGRKGGEDHPSVGGPATGTTIPTSPTTVVVSEALAGTRPRGSTPEADQELSFQLFASAKDQAENQITGRFITEAFERLQQRGWVRPDEATGRGDTTNDSNDDTDREPSSGSVADLKSGGGTKQGRYFVRRLRHLQHLCQQFECELAHPSYASDAIQYLLESLHPTPAVAGYPKEPAMDFIRRYEGIGFDRGYYAGPIGFVGNDEAEVVVAIRSGLVSRGSHRQDPEFHPFTNPGNSPSPIVALPKVSVFAGAGLVPGSTVQGEWAETSYKLAVVSSIFPQSPITLQGAKTPNSAWATAFVEELVRNGVTQFYICPGSRSTPLVAAVARAVRSSVGIVHAQSIHDERGAAFRAVGYARGVGRPAAVITSSGTAIANLYPAIVEAGMDAVPLLIVTADRPYESRDTGANQAIDQVKAYSQSYVRWFRDILPPHDDVPVSVALADASHGVRMSRDLQGPVHLNVQFRENLAPDAGQIRNDDRVGSITRFNNARFTDASGFHRWSLGGRPWVKSFAANRGVDSQSVVDILRLIMESRRGIIVVGNIRKPTGDNQADISQTMQQISAFAQSVGFPIFAGVQSGSLRFESAAVIPFAEHILRCSEVQKNLKPDLVLQFGAPLISTEIHKLIKETMSDQPTHHVLVHPHHASERADPEFTVSHRVNADIGCFLRQLVELIHAQKQSLPGSQLAPLVSLGRILQSEMPNLVEQVVTELKEKDPQFTEMTEPQIVLNLSKVFTSTAAPDMSLFLSNSMPVRDAEAFLYPICVGSLEHTKSALKDTGVNRGASGIDGVIASAAGFADSTGRPTSLLIGDVAALHDINSLHALRTAIPAQEAQSQKIHPLTTIVLNNDGGGIFSFLPIAKFAGDVGFDEFFGTPTSSFSFEKGASAFDIPFQRVESIESFVAAYTESLSAQKPSMIEAVVASRAKNVVVHKEITGRVNKFVSNVLSSGNPKSAKHEILPLKHTRAGEHVEESDLGKKTLVLLHGWMGDSSDWDEVEAQLLRSLPSEWSILSLDLPGHGNSPLLMSSEVRSINNALGLLDSMDNSENCGFALDDMARTVCRTLEYFGVKSIDALAGYSLGGRVALAMKRLSMHPSEVDAFARCIKVREDTKLILLSAYPGEILGNRIRSGSDLEADKRRRTANDERLASEMDAIASRQKLMAALPERAPTLWSDFLYRWYEAPLWGSIRKKSTLYKRLVEKRAQALSFRGYDLAAVLRQCSPSKCSNEDWRGAIPKNTMFMAGELDQKYCNIGREWYDVEPSLLYLEVPRKGHALLVEAAGEVAEATSAFLLRNEDDGHQTNQSDIKIWNTRFIPLEKRGKVDSAVRRIDTQFTGSIGSLDFEAFALEIGNKRGRTEGVFGVGWGEESKAWEKESLKQRSGFVIQLTSKDGLRVGVGEVSPLVGLHPESLSEAGVQLELIAGRFADLEPDFVPSFDVSQVLALDGALASYLDSLRGLLKIENFLASVRSGLEMSILSLASQIVRSPIHEALVANAPHTYGLQRITSVLPLNGLVTRNPDSRPMSTTFLEGKPSYSSWKVKIAHQSTAKDIDTIRSVLESNTWKCKVRADANRGFKEQSTYTDFIETLEAFDTRILGQIEYIEEPLTKILNENGSWSFEHQVQALERCFNKTSIAYALDESLFDLIENHGDSFDEVLENLKQVFGASPRGCAAFVLKPSLLGLEASLRLARLARMELGIGAVFSSSFDSGVGLAYSSFMGSLSDATPGKSGVQHYPHGLSTFDEMTSDCLSPAFGSYVNDEGMLNVCSLSRAFYGLALDEIQSLSSTSLPPPLPVLEKVTEAAETSSLYSAPNDDQIRDFFPDDFEASTSTSNSGRDIVLVASLPLPFSADIACGRFTDLPQQPRWSPWLASVAYLDAANETEWTLRVRGVSFRWRAKSEFLDAPFKGIRWKSISGLKTTGVVEFIPATPASGGGDGAVVETCVMKVRMAFVTPRLLSSLFRGTVLEDFLRNKIMKWSMEMFRDVVKGDLALEEGNVELGDALFGAVEGKASAIEATLASSSPASSTSSPPFFDDDRLAL